MSSRNLRNIVYGQHTLPAPECDGGADFVPLYTKAPASNNFQGLAVSSHSEAEHDEPSSPDTPIKKNKKKRKKKNKQNATKGAVASTSKETHQVDEIDKIVLEVNAILGTPPVEKPASPIKPSKREILFAIQQKHLDQSIELRHRFGADGAELQNRGRKHHQNPRLRMKAVIVQMPNNGIQYREGLTMSLQRTESNCKYFTFDHSADYRVLHAKFLTKGSLPRDDIRNIMHVESMLQAADLVFRLEEYEAASKAVELVIAYMQHVSHPTFVLTDQNVRLEYRYVENRIFHIAVLKYLYLLSNKACHRTALELCKLLLNLDPSDPLAVVLVIDIIALRAREHQWLIDVIDLWSQERGAGYLFNLQYSYAMAHFHVATKTSGDLTHADALLQDAMLRFPDAVMKILNFAGLTNPPERIIKNNLFNGYADATTTLILKQLINLYAKLSGPKWRESPVMDWFIRNAEELADKFDNDEETKRRSSELKVERIGLLQDVPDEIYRHLCVISPLSALVAGGAVPVVKLHHSFDPLPPKNGICRYDYQTPRPGYTNSQSVFYQLLLSLLPNYALPAREPHVDGEVANADEEANENERM